MVATVAATTSTLRARVHATLRHSDDSRSGRRWRAFHLLVLGSGLLAVAVSSVPSLPDAVEHLLAFVIALVAAVFLVEYALRLWSAPETPRYGGLSEGRARLAWALSATGLIGLLAVVPAFAITLRAIRADSDIAAIFCILWILKLSVHAPAMTTLARVISNERATLASVLIIFVIVLVAAATATHFFERSD
jgi:voltage-gated potassium channel